MHTRDAVVAAWIPCRSVFIPCSNGFPALRLDQRVPSGKLIRREGCLAWQDRRFGPTYVAIRPKRQLCRRIAPPKRHPPQDCSAQATPAAGWGFPKIGGSDYFATGSIYCRLAARRRRPRNQETPPPPPKSGDAAAAAEEEEALRRLLLRRAAMDSGKHLLHLEDEPTYPFPEGFYPGKGELLKANVSLQAVYGSLFEFAAILRERQATRGIGDMSSYGKETQAIFHKLKDLREDAFLMLRKTRRIGRAFEMPLDLENELFCILGPDAEAWVFYK